MASERVARIGAACAAAVTAIAVESVPVVMAFAVSV
jgi:hypothetical protein